MGFIDRFSQKSPLPNYTQICPVEALLIHMGRHNESKRHFCSYEHT